MRTAGGERRRGETGQRGLLRDCSDFWGPGAWAIEEASEAAGSSVGVVSAERTAVFCEVVGMLLRVRVGLVSCGLFLRDAVGETAADVGCCCCCCCVDFVDTGAGDGVDVLLAAVTLMVLRDRIDGRAGEVSRDANGDVLADVAADAGCEGCAVCIVGCASSCLRIDEEDDSRASVGCGWPAWVAGAPFSAPGDLTIAARCSVGRGSARYVANAGVACGPLLLDECRRQAEEEGSWPLPQSKSHRARRVLCSRNRNRQSIGGTV